MSAQRRVGVPGGRVKGLVVWFALCLGVARGAPEDGSTPAELRAEVERLRRQVGLLSEALVRARTEADALRMCLDKRQVAPEPTGRLPDSGALTDVWLIDVNPELGLVVLNAGRREGVKAGMEFALTREGRKVGEARVIDVRETIAGAVVTSHGRWGFPKVEDRAVLVGGPAQ